jgi:tetraacyldisaccharide 4'-kinase
MASIDSIETLKEKNILLLTGIASPEQLMHDLQAYHSQITPLTFGDHHNFSRKDIQTINEAFAQLPEPRLVLTTEKDATRLMVVDGLSDEVKRHLYVLPLRIAIMQGQQKEFNQKILGYVFKNSRNSVLAKRKDDHKSQNSNSSGDRPRTISFRNN